MKSFRLICFFLLFTSIAQAQSDSAYLFRKGNKIEVSNYWWMGFGKFKELPKINYEVKNVEDSSSWKVSTLSKTISQNKGRSLFKREIQLKSDGKDVYYDLSFWLIDTILQKELQSLMDIKTDTLFYFAFGTPMSFPLKGSPDDVLKPYTYLLVETNVFDYMEEKKSSRVIYSDYYETTYNITKRIPKTNRTDWTSREINFDYRKIVGTEKVTTPAGTWSCYKIISKDSKAKGMYKDIYLIDYFSPGFGLVKSESYYKKRMTGYSEVSRLY